MLAFRPCGDTSLQRLDISLIHSIIHVFIHTYIDYNELLTIIRGLKKREKEESKNVKLNSFRGRCVEAKGAKLSSWPLPQHSYKKRK